MFIPRDHAEAEAWQKAKDHEIVAVLRKAADGQHVYDDEITDLQLGSGARSALLEAIKRVSPTPENLQTRGNTLHDYAKQYALDIVRSLPEHHETKRQREERRADAGDPEAIRNIRDRRNAGAELAERILARKRGGI